MNLVPCADAAAWDAFVRASPQANVFCESWFLDCLQTPYDRWFVEEEGRTVLGALIVKDKDGAPVATPFPYSLYQGLLFAGGAADLAPHSRVKSGLAIGSFALEALEAQPQYDRLLFCLHPRFEDLRCLSWFNYHQSERGRFAIDLYYTGIIDLERFSDFEAYLASVRQTRRWEYRKGFKNGLTCEVSAEVTALQQLYRLTFERQGIAVSDEQSELLTRISKSAIESGRGELLHCRVPNGDVASATLFLFDRQVGYYLFGANHPEYRNSNSGTVALLDSVRRAKERGLQRVDVCGINSPNRGDFKTSINAAPVPYFIARWEKSAPSPSL